MCNILVCLAVWIGFSARTVADKVLGILLPISAFVACGFEHCVANMFFLPMGLLLNSMGVGAADAVTLVGIATNLPRSATSSAASPSAWRTGSCTGRRTRTGRDFPAGLSPISRFAIAAGGCDTVSLPRRFALARFCAGAISACKATLHHRAPHRVPHAHARVRRRGTAISATTTE